MLSLLLYNILVNNLPRLEKFPDTGINQLDGYGPADWPQSVGYVSETIRTDRERALSDIEQIPLTERQLFAIQNLALPAITDTLSGILGNEAAAGLIGRTFLSYLTERNFDAYYGGANNAAGAYFAGRNQITVREVSDGVDSPEGLAQFIKVFVHEYFHYLSHQSSSYQDEQLSIKRVGVVTLGNDIRNANEGMSTWDYFLSHNEAITERLTIETLQKIANDTTFKNLHGIAVGFYQTYPEYRTLLDKVMDDAISYHATELTRPDLWRSICRGYLSGDLRPLIQLIHITYPGIKAREFGLMTHVDDLPNVSDFVSLSLDDRHPLGGRTYRVSNEYLIRLRNRLNAKTRHDYVHDLGLPPPPPPPTSPAVIIHQRDIESHQQQKLRYLTATRRSDGLIVDEQDLIVQTDENGNFVHYDQAWLLDLLPILADTSTRFRNGEISQDQAESIIDKVLFEQLHISELSSGFGEFYIIKHVLLDPDTTTRYFNACLRMIDNKLSELQGQKG
jgi:hypothetical protein